ncbi:cyclic peptide export ABC transporter [Microbulbifer elongatus]|uniref:cyclic peptide export ABC transporter n=1 Tax=Microbulbifer elongatus TaxID=86173 RepID=UPI001E541B90|nr:cyclic peptide export ABC transporter [Microbulbifer elongatus]
MLSYLIRQSRLLLIAASIASVVSAICGVLMISRINTALTADNHTPVLMWSFFGLIVLLMLGRILSSALFERLAQHSMAELRRYIAGKILTAELRQLELIGSARLHSALSEHCASVVQFFVTLPSLLNHSVVVVGCMIYMLALSWQIFLAALVMIGLGSLGHFVAQAKATAFLRRSSIEQDRLFGYFRALTDGAKELRLNESKRRVFRDDLLGKSIETVRKNRTAGASLFMISSRWGNFLIYAFIGLVLFVLSENISNREQVMTGFALVFFFMMGPLEGLLGAIPRAKVSGVAADRIDDIIRELEAAAVPVQGIRRASFTSIRLKNVLHRYYHEQSNELFQLGPVNLEFRPGTVTFLVGGNGSGKTTLAKLVTGLYAPESGAIFVDDTPIDDADRDGYRQLFSAVFSDFHLFERLMEVGCPELDETGNALISKLQLQHKVTMRHGAFSTQSLSQGQRKRLALVVAHLEDRPFLVFDEWAADQDPTFKDVFYRELLPELKSAGKTVLVISHDDRYFHLGDRILKLEHGRLLAAEVPEPS